VFNNTIYLSSAIDRHRVFVFKSIWLFQLIRILYPKYTKISSPCNRSVICNLFVVTFRYLFFNEYIYKSMFCLPCEFSKRPVSFKTIPHSKHPFFSPNKIIFGPTTVLWQGLLQPRFFPVTRCRYRL
jgi:hypothetical protein